VRLGRRWRREDVLVDLALAKAVHGEEEESVMIFRQPDLEEVGTQGRPRDGSPIGGVGGATDYRQEKGDGDRARENK
jgi:hypothetical protein